jgi:hypothetical protein
MIDIIKNLEIPLIKVNSRGFPRFLPNYSGPGQDLAFLAQIYLDVLEIPLSLQQSTS